MRARDAAAAILAAPRSADGRTVRWPLGGETVDVDAASVQAVDGGVLMLCRGAAGRRLVVIAEATAGGLCDRFRGTDQAGRLSDAGATTARICPLDRGNAEALRALLPWTRPVTLGLGRSFGCGDRLGVANAAHLRALAGSDFRPVLAQQSIRELTRTGREPLDVLDAATWAALREGFTDGFGADADHLKTVADIDRMVDAGFTMFTFDPGEHVNGDLEAGGETGLAARAMALPWPFLETTLDEALARFADRRIEIAPAAPLRPSRAEVLRALVKYGSAIAHVVTLFRHLAARMGGRDFEVEVSVDETDSPTTPFEHYLVARELRRLGVCWVGLAPRFVGSFEKGIDFRGDLTEFRADLVAHLGVAATCGPYKLSIHSGSDKFSVYRELAGLGAPPVHVKTAGTSYLEALRTIAGCEPSLFRAILDFSLGVFPGERRSYHVSAEPEAVAAALPAADVALPALLDHDPTRQVLHVAFGRVLTERGADGAPRFRERLLGCLLANESAHEDNVERHVRRHLAALKPAPEAR